MAHPAGAAYPFPLHSPGFAPSSGPGARASASQDNMSGYYSQQQAHYAPVTEASSPWDEYMVQ
jgi:hypothetical protein